MKILLAEDEKAIRITLADDLEDAGHKVDTAPDGHEAMATLERETYDLVITDIRMPGPDGVAILKHVKENLPDTEVIMITGVPTYQLAVECIKGGAYDFIDKPFDNEEVVQRLEKLEELIRLRDENRRLRSEVDRATRFDNLIGRSPRMQRTFEEIQSLAESDVSIILYGESGTGKELFAQAIHRHSNRANHPWVVVNCRTQENLVDDMLFGHLKGAYTGASEDRRGKFEEANGGTLFLDDVDDLPLDTQAKILRALQEGEVERLGATVPTHVDVRVIAATKVQLEDLIDEGKFREDLYFRLRVLQIDIPPLRQRTEDIPLLVDHFIKKHGQPGREYEIPPEAMLAITQYRWPGNVRELEQSVKAALALAGRGTVLKKEFFSRSMRRTISLKNEEAGGGPLVTLGEVVESAERQHIQRVLRFTEGNTVKAAEVLGISRKNLWEKRKKYQIES